MIQTKIFRILKLGHLRGVRKKLPELVIVILSEEKNLVFSSSYEILRFPQDDQRRGQDDKFDFLRNHPLNLSRIANIENPYF